MTRNTANDMSNGHLDLAIPPPSAARGGIQQPQPDPLASLSGTLLDVRDQYAQTSAGLDPLAPLSWATSSEAGSHKQPRIDQARLLLAKSRAYVQAEPRTAVLLAATIGAAVAATVGLMLDSPSQRR